MISVIAMAFGVLITARTFLWVVTSYLAKTSYRDVEIETIENELRHLRKLKQMREKKRSMERYER